MVFERLNLREKYYGNALIYRHIIFQAEFSKGDYAVSKCDMPIEDTVIHVYIISTSTAFILMLCFLLTKYCIKKQTTQKKEL